MILKRFLKRSKEKILLVLLLVLANALYPIHDFLSWLVTLSFFLLIPGFLLLRTITKEVRNRWEVLSFSLALSILILMVGGLILNTLHHLGLHRPLGSLNVFITFDLISLILIVLSKKLTLPSTKSARKISLEQVFVTIAITIIPILAIAGAIRLNNGGSNIFTMIMFGAVAALFLWLLFRKNLKPLYPYAVIMFGIAVLYSTSLRGWSVTGHDIQHEFEVFRFTNLASYWNVNFPVRDPYNACLSLTILPTVIDKMTHIPAPYVYKIVFQTIFGVGLAPIYLLIKRLKNSRSGLIGSLIFISFPPFFNDMPFLNRQEIAFVFFSLMLLACFSKIKSRSKTLLTTLLLIGIILSHYSSGYVTLGMLLFAFIIYKLITYHKKIVRSQVLPLLSLPIICCALLFTFLWNAQITSTTSGLKQTITSTFDSLKGQSSSQSTGVSYGLFSPTAESPEETLSTTVGYPRSNQMTYSPPSTLPNTRFGNAVSALINPATLNSLLRSFAAKILQVLLLLSVVVLFFRYRKRLDDQELYFYSLTVACVIELVLITVLPQVSVDYGVTRLFQQTLIITALPIIIALEFVVGFLGRFKIYFVAIFFAFFFLDLSGFIPQIFGGYPPQLALNNSGVYFDIYDTHKGEIVSYDWLASTDKGLPVTIDAYAYDRLNYYGSLDGRIVQPFAQLSKGPNFVYQDYSNYHEGLYGAYLNGDVIEYSYPNLIQGKDLIYTNQTSRIFEENSGVSQ
jgi:uncharacterized membrane protein